jgi:cytochrome c-type biogenesis protein CcmH
MLWLALAFMGLCAAALVALPFLGPLRAEGAAPEAGEKLRAELDLIASAQARGELNEEGAKAARIDAERRALSAPARAQTAPSPADRRAAASAAGAVLAGAALLYAITGKPDAPAASATAPPSAQAELARLTATLEQRLKQAPGDGDGWRALGWAYFIAARYEQSSQAYARAVALKPQSASFRSAYGESLVGAARGAVTAQAESAFRDALKLDKTDVRARYYLGLAKAQSSDPKAAIDAWMQLYHEAAPASQAAQDLRQRIEALAAQTGTDVSARLAQPGPNARQVDAAANLSDQQRNAMIEAMVATLDQRLRANPHNLEGWARLVHARVVQGKADEAGEALKRARAAFAGDAQAQARLDQVAADAGIAMRGKSQ